MSARAGMMMDLREAALAVGGRVEGEAVAFGGVSTDSRTIAPGELFVALKGERFDGHEHVGEARSRGAVAALVSRSHAQTPLVIADDTRAALGRLAAHWRARHTLPLVALTGSNGKT
ncbi:MAG: Mur ligase domain-containing protein, partial [Usitatibacter sp.]